MRHGRHDLIDINRLIREGNAGISALGRIVDRRAFKDAAPLDTDGQRFEAETKKKKANK